MPRVGFEPTIAMFGRAKIFDILNRTNAVIGEEETMRRLNSKKACSHAFRIICPLVPYIRSKD
jgi:hypothetical protein